ncbi:DMT family transporter [Luedemannella helvata]|uniref:DMT family transporter n=1 Tax=Luedemannella helvata TaxID=349315 RepID=UPI003CD096E8
MSPQRPHVASFTALGIAVVAISSSGPLIAYAAAPALAIAFWRNAMAVGLQAPWAVARRRELVALARAPHRREGLFCLLAGVALAGHFATWVPSAKLTSVATATALVATQPVWQGVIAAAQGKRLPVPTWVGIGLAVCGAVAITGADLHADGTAVLGDILALAGAVLAAAYTAFGERARVTTSTTAYTTVCYTACGLILLTVCLVGGVPLTGYPATAWVALAAITLGPQLLGHSLLSYALRRIAATTISLVVLLEVPGAALLGWVWLDQRPGLASLPGVVLLVGGVVLVLSADRRAARRVPVPDPPPLGIVPDQRPTAELLASHNAEASAGSAARRDG